MPHTQTTIHNIDGFFYSPSQVIKNKRLSERNKKIGFLTSGALLDSRVCKVLNEIIQVPKPCTEIPAEISLSMEKNFWPPLRAWREYLYLSSEYMAKEMDMDLENYLDIENQPFKNNDDMLQRLATKFGIHRNLLIQSVEKYNQSCVLLKGVN